jgi:hypothetical protein
VDPGQRLHHRAARLGRGKGGQASAVGPRREAGHAQAGGPQPGEGEQLQPVQIVRLGRIDHGDAQAGERMERRVLRGEDLALALGERLVEAAAPFPLGGWRRGRGVLAAGKGPGEAGLADVDRAQRREVAALVGDPAAAEGEALLARIAEEVEHDRLGAATGEGLGQGAHLRVRLPAHDADRRGAHAPLRRWLASSSR